MNLIVFSFLFCASALGLVQSRTPLLGAWKHLTDLTSPLLKKSAEQSLALYELANPGGKVERVSKVLDAYSQVVSGLNLRLVVQVDVLSCTVDEYDPDLCKVEKTGVCFFQLNSQSSTAEETLTFSICPGFVPVEYFSSLFNTWLPVDPDYYVALKYAALAVTKVDSSYKLESLTESTCWLEYTLAAQYVEYKLQVVVVSDKCVSDSTLCEKRLLCNLVLKVELWGDVTTLTSSECKSNELVKPFVGSEEGTVVGGWTPVDPESPEVKAVVTKAVKLYETQTGVEVVTYSVQKVLQKVENGMKHRVSLHLIECKDSSFIISLENCRPSQTCLFEVYLKQWSRSFTLTPLCQELNYTL